MTVNDGQTILAADFTSVTILPQTTYPVDGVPFANVLTGNTTLHVSQVHVPRAIKVNKVSIHLGTSVATGTLKVCLFSEDGQTQIINFETTTIDTTNDNGILTHTLASETLVNPGIYYFTILPTGTTNIEVLTRTSLVSAELDVIKNGVTSEPDLEGTITVTASTMPTTITPTSITFVTSKGFVFRLDN